MSELIDNRAHRVRQLKAIIKHLHEGRSPDEVKHLLKKLVGETDYSEIVAMEQELMAEGMPVEEIRSMCDLHSQVTREVMVQLQAPPVPPGHPLDTMRRENQALRETVQRARRAMAAIEALPDDADAGEALLAWRQAYNDLMDIEKHYQRKEHAFFPKLEAHGITGPSKVMWAKDDEVRAMLKVLGAELAGQGKAAHWKAVAAGIGRRVLDAVEEMIYKEDNILLRICQDTFTEEDWAEIWESCPRYGWCLVEPRQGYRPPESKLKEGVKLPAVEGLQLPTGTLTAEQLAGIFAALPVDVTFVDAEDRVVFFSEGPERTFARSRAILGRLVQHCHPPKSVDVVERILSDFRTGRQNVAEFWINFHGRFIHIRYFAVRNEEGKYLGTLEVTQDLTRLRRLEGERRLLEYDAPAA